MRSSTRRASKGGLVALVGLALACSDATMQPDPGKPLPPTPFVVSNPVPDLAPSLSEHPASHPAALATFGSSVIYISLPPGAIPGATGASIHDRRAGSSANVVVVNGGFDPVAVGAAVGDTIEVVVLGAVAPSLSYLIVVSEKTRPTVVRTSPPSHKRDVPLNTIILVVFSEPMDSASLTSAVTLTDGGLPISGKVVISPNSGEILDATFVPDAPLAPLTTYQLQIAGTARDRDGDPITIPVQADFTTSALSADVSPPVITILSPGPGDTMPVGFPRFLVRLDEDHDLMEIDYEMLDQQPGGAPPDIRSAFGGLTDYIGTNWHSVESQIGPGDYMFQMRASDGSGNVGTSAQIPLTFVDPDPQPRIVVRSFSVVEVNPNPDFWYYAPQLVVADAPGQSGLEPVGVEMLAIPGLQSPFPISWALPQTIPPEQDTPLFHEVYGDYELSYFAADGHRSSGGQASMRLTYRDTEGHYYITTLTGPIVSGGLPGTYSGGCGHWIGEGVVSANSRCPAALRVTP